MTYFPPFEAFQAMSRRGGIVPVYRDILADLETPVSAFLKIHQGKHGFLLESMEGGEKWGRYSFLGTDPALTFTSKGPVVEVISRTGEVRRFTATNPFTALQELIEQYQMATVEGLPRFAGGLVGYIAYDLVRFFERLPQRVPDDLSLPDAYFVLPDTLLIFDNIAQKIKVLALAFVGDGTDLPAAYDEAVARIDAVVARLSQERVATYRGGEIPAARHAGEVRSNLFQADYEAAVRRAKEYIRAGDIIQVVLAQRFEVPLQAAPFNVYRCLRTINPSPYMFYLHLGDLVLAGTSPEVMVRVEGGEVTVRPIAGTRPRGTVEVEDRRQEEELLTDPKEIAEHVMLLDLGRNDVGRVARIGSVAVTEKMAVERYSHVMHLVSNVRGELAEGKGCFDAFRSTFPAGTLTGAPKIRAMEIIEELEPVRRGVYGGAVGYFGFSGNMDTGIAIRTILMHGGKAYVQAGAGIVADSDPEREHLECVNKARGMLQAIRIAEGF
jgi:anthranilate synthase component 1